jgi:hypothetical protein
MSMYAGPIIKKIANIAAKIKDFTSNFVIADRLV